MGNTIKNHTFLTMGEAAALLQPHIHSKFARDWLAYDRLKDPVLPFVIFHGEPYYRKLDVANFVVHVLNPSARFVRIHNHLVTESRKSSDRRRLDDRRRKEAIQLQPGIERRQRDQPDRRLRGDSNRRTQAVSH
jgi:hypothetical protein